MIIWDSIAAVSSVVASIATFLIWNGFRYHFQYWDRRQIPHVPPTIPKGNMKEWLHSKHLYQIFADTYQAFKNQGYPFAGFYFNTKQAVVALDLEFVKQVLTDNCNYFENRGLFHNETDDPLTGNLFLLDGPKWKTLRDKLAPTFTLAKMKYMLPTVLNMGEELQKAFSDQLANDRVFDITYLLNRFTCDVIGNCVFGMDCTSLKNPHTDFYVMARKFFSETRHSNIVDSLINCFPDHAKSLRMQIIPQDVTDYYIKVFRQTITDREKNNIRKPDYLDLLMELKKTPAQEGEEKFSVEELAAQAFVFFITAFDTCSSTISFALYELAQHPDIQISLRRDMKRILKIHKQKLTFACLENMKYLDQVVSETLRKYPVTPALFRKCTKLFTPPQMPNFHIEKDCLVIIPIMSFHYDEKHFPKPFDFEPERFSTDKSSTLKPYTYLPYGEGPRNCIGSYFSRLQINIALVKLITKFKFEICYQTTVPVQIVIPAINLIPTNVTLKVTKL